MPKEKGGGRGVNQRGRSTAAKEKKNRATETAATWAQKRDASASAAKEKRECQRVATG